MTKRKIIKIDEDRCTGCGLCIPNCPEGALQIIDKKVRIISDLFCDGLGACIGHCPEGAISIEEREAEAYDERRVMENVVKQGENVIKAHLAHLKDHGEEGYLKEATDYLKEKGIKVSLDEKLTHPSHGNGHGGCPGSKMMNLKSGKESAKGNERVNAGESQLRQWPIQIMLVPAHAPYFKGADLLIAADCVPFTYPGFHQDLLRGKILLVGCPKLDDANFFKERISQILKENDIKSVTCAHMEVPCCFGLVNVVEEAILASGKNVPYKDVNISIKGEKL